MVLGVQFDCIMGALKTANRLHQDRCQELFEYLRTLSDCD
jgi:hypothetical protein